MRALTPWITEPPVRVGWYNASTERNAETRRYWNGEYWSVPVYVGDPDDRVDRARSARAESQDGIEWRGISVAFLDSEALQSLSRAFFEEIDSVLDSTNRKIDLDYVRECLRTADLLTDEVKTRTKMIKVELRRLRELDAGGFGDQA